MLNYIINNNYKIKLWLEVMDTHAYLEYEILNKSNSDCTTDA